MVPVQFAATLQQIRQSLCGVEGWLSDREMEFLALAAACPTARGDLLEIGSFRGRSTIALALAARLADPRIAGADARIVAIDPMLDDDPLMSAPVPPGTARRTFAANLQRAGVTDQVEFHQAFSYQIADRWQRPLRLLWIDGDHRYASTKQDFDLYTPFLADGAILAMHDVLSPYDGCLRVFLEDVLTSDRVGAVGLCGSIGWAQFAPTLCRSAELQRGKQQLARQLRRLLPYHLAHQSPRGLSKWRYKWLRSRVPHGAIQPHAWAMAVHASATAS